MRTPIQRGFGLIEAMVTIAVLAILLAVAVPSFQQMIANSRTRTIAESFRAGVDLARTEAMRRNLPVGFAVVSAVTGCSADTTGTNWVVFLGTTCNNDATVVQRFVAGGSEAGVTVSTSRGTLIFNGIGMSVGGATATIDFGNNLPSAQRRTLRLGVSAGGQTRLCEPGITASGDPRAC
ncbi:MAG TPA: GspH/FimT family pseudopilin [Thauera aminoaromatica]|jgi:type IV fimbrial biogenesis protein FimT|nr:prepilin-type N-terminal cleavage/methylation domain-containing protein [Thauera sp. UPWRP]HMX12658.1 GspH/FimT family pseudopilin [Thauera aminoaromatica]HMY78562.1 GspH/FimT family pseudopilin [Thauera aminoaromatica]HMZ28309.1 GspH/FimT family pseudopilin [Thauera aminoaromatica]HNG64701.1 GspH/FimT family pseudopilin [Thauera aminoaromatica]